MSAWILVASALAAEPAGPAPAEPPTDPPAPSTDPPAPAAAPPCAIEVVRVISDERFRGHRLTPALAATIDAMGPEDQAMWNAESHAASYRQCTYEVQVNGDGYRFVEDWDTTFDDKPADWCRQARAEVAATVRSTTRDCTDLHRGAWWGHDLVPLEAPAE